MDISSSNYFSVSASTNKGMSGMISGMDTENMVKQMLSGTQGKIDKQQGLKTQTEWKQDMYREMISSINGFQDKYFSTAFDSGLATNFARSDFFNNMLSKISSGSAIKVISTDPTASIGDTNIIVKQLADSAKMQSSQRMSGSTLKIDGGEITEASLKRFDKSVTFNVGTEEIKVELGGSDPIDPNDGAAMDKIADRFNKAMADKGISPDTVKAEVYKGRLRFITSTNTKISMATEKDPVSGKLVHKSSALGLSMTGLSSIGNTVIKDKDGNPTNMQMFQGGEMQPKAGVTFNMTMDGITKQIMLNDVKTVDGVTDKDSLAAALKKEVAKAFGEYVQVDRLDATGAVLADGAPGTDKIRLRLDVKGELGHQLTVTGADSSVVGITAGATTNIHSGTKLGDIAKQIDAGSGVKLQGDRYSFTINGEEFSFKNTDSLGTMLNTINNSSAGVRIAYSALSDKFSIESTSTGSKYGVNITQTEGNLLSVMFGEDKVSNSTSVASKELTTGTITAKGNGLPSDYTTASTLLKMNVNEKDYTFSLPIRKDILGRTIAYSKSEIETEFNSWLKKTFNTVPKDDDTGTANISATFPVNGAPKLTIADGFVVKFAKTAVDQNDAKAMAAASKTDLALALGFNLENKSNVANGDTKLSDILQIKDRLGEFGIADADKDNAVSTLTDAANGFTFSGGRLVKRGEGTVTLSGTLGDLFEEPTTPPGSVTFEFGTFRNAALTGNPGAPSLVGGKIVEKTTLGDIKELAGFKFITTVGSESSDGTWIGRIKEIVLDDGTKLDVKFDEVQQKLLLTEAYDYSGDAKMVALFGQIGTGLKGQDAILNINGTDTTRSSNTFTVDGITIQATALSPSTDGTDADGKPIKIYSDPTTITTERDTDTIVKGFESFVEDYNKMLDLLNGFVDADRTYRKYDPLTADQRKEMSDKEVELWEEKAKEGLLHRESDVDVLLSSMRTAMFTKPDSGKLALYDIGVETGQYKEKGKLTMNESKLRSALSSDPASVISLFTGTDGLASQMMKAMKTAANLSAASPGSLVQTAGMKGWASESNNTLTTNIKSINEKIRDLQVKYEKERQRYWNQFNNMEKTMSQFNNQSGYLSQQFG